MLPDERRRRFAGCKCGMSQAVSEKGVVGCHAECHGLLEAVNQLAPRLVTGGAMADQLCYHRVIERRDLGAGLQRVLDTQFIRHLPQCHPAGLRHEIVGGVLRAQPHFDRVAGKLDVFLPKSERFAASDAQLQFDQIKPGDRLGNGMFDLQARIHFHEIEFA